MALGVCLSTAQSDWLVQSQQGMPARHCYKSRQELEPAKQVKSFRLLRCLAARHPVQKDEILLAQRLHHLSPIVLVLAR